MTTNHKPATPLPWSGDMAFFVYGKADARYAAHAANAYPRLVEALRDCIKGMPHNPPQQRAVDLLRELGEE